MKDPKAFAIVQLTIDPLSEILSLLRPQSALSLGLDLAGDWSFHFGPPIGVKFNAILNGTCWLRIEGQMDWRRLDAGDCFLLARPAPFTLASHPDAASTDTKALYRDAKGPIVTWNGGGETKLIGGRFTFPDTDLVPLIATFPPSMVVKGQSAEAAVLHWALDQLATEMENPRPGQSLLSDHLAHLMLVHMLRIHLAREDQDAAGWLRALSDRQLTRAVTAFHAAPGDSWTLGDLATEAGMSRSSFVSRFRRIVGMSVAEYLGNWRMMLARDRLARSRDPVATIAAAVGYNSEAAFITAFKRLTQVTPAQYRRNCQVRNG